MALKVYYHVYTTGDIHGDLYIIDEQIKALQWSGLIYYADINAVISGVGCYYAKDLLERTLGVDRRRTVRIVECTEGDPEGLYEGRTLRYLWQEAEQGDEICYIHTKGISYLTGQRTVAGEMKPRHIKAINGWRTEMENKILTEWRVCPPGHHCWCRWYGRCGGCHLLPPRKRRRPQEHRSHGHCHGAWCRDCCSNVTVHEDDLNAAAHRHLQRCRWWCSSTRRHY